MPRSAHMLGFIKTFYIAAEAALSLIVWCATVRYEAGGGVMHTWRSFAVVACVVLGMSDAARAG